MTFPNCIFKNEKPSGVPPLVLPTLLKQDVEGLKKDIPKFFGHMPSRQQEFWERILQNPEDLIQQGSSENWTLPNLKNPRRPGVARNESDDKIPDDISQLREKETAPLEEVNIFGAINRYRALWNSL